MTSNAPRKGSAEKSIPHTRIIDDDGIKESYEIGRKLGEGSFGKVYFATSKATGLSWAIKSINKEKAGSKQLMLLEREVAILKRVKHPNIIQLNEVIESNKRMYLVTAVCEHGELSVILKTRHFTETETKSIMKKLASAISYLHKNDIVHRDLKLENILLSNNPDDPEDKLHIQVTDFGLSVVKDGVGHDNMMQDFCGTPIYMAPEIIDNKTYSQMCDVWAMGVIMYMLLCGYPPFTADSEDRLYEIIKKAEVKFEGAPWDTISSEAKNCIEGMLHSDPAHRITAGEVLHHSWITGESHDTSRPKNVLEMMRMFREEKDSNEPTEVANGDMKEEKNEVDQPTDKTEVDTQQTKQNKNVVGRKTSSTTSSSTPQAKSKHSVTGSHPSGVKGQSGSGYKLSSNSVKPKTSISSGTKPKLK